MAAIDLERGLEHSGRAWGKERPELMDNFDSEMQEWEDQLQDIQRKIEELYNDVQARRGANDVADDDQKDGGERARGPGHRGEDRPGAIAVPRHYGNGGYGDPASHGRDFGYCHAGSEIGDLLQDYLGQGQQMSRKNHGARHVRFSDTIKVSPATEMRKSSGNERLGQEQLVGTFEQTENWKNQVSHLRSSPNKENTGAKPPLGQRDAPSAAAPRSPPPAAIAESPALDRKAFGAGALADRKCGSPSVLRKFGAMLQENEGKTLTESGVVTHQVAASEPKCPAPGCQRRAPGATAGACKAAPVRATSAHKCHADADVLTATETEARGQERGSASDPGRPRGAFGGPKGSHWGPQQSQRRSQVAGSPKPRPRANSGADRDVERARKPAPHHAEPKMDHVVSSGGQKIHRGGSAGNESAGCGRARDEGLIELLDMLEIQHEYGSSPRAGHAARRQDPPQANPAQLSPANRNGSFSRPARPANQRPPSRWAAAAAAAPSGPTYCAPSPLARPPSPRTRTPSPALKHRALISYSRQTETVIM
ncbi:kiaa0408 [Pungitius sinensis]